MQKPRIKVITGTLSRGYALLFKDQTEFMVWRDGNSRHLGTAPVQVPLRDDAAGQTYEINYFLLPLTLNGKVITNYEYAVKHYEDTQIYADTSMPPTVYIGYQIWVISQSFYVKV